MNNIIDIEEYRFTIIKTESEEIHLFLRLETDPIQSLYLRQFSESANRLPVNVFNDPRTYLALQYRLSIKLNQYQKLCC